MAAKNVFVLGGTGHVGGEVMSQIAKWDQQQDAVRLDGFSNSHSYVAHVSDEDIARALEMMRMDGKAGIERFLAEASGNGNIFAAEIGETKSSDVNKLVRSLLTQGYIVVDTTALGAEVLEAYRFAAKGDNKGALVTANKKPLVAATPEDFRAFVRARARMAFDPTVMAGNGAVREVMEATALRDSVSRIEGCFSGTLGYLCTKLEGGAPFTQALQEARERGLTEPDPRDDLRGDDVARKLLILSRLSMGEEHDLEMGDIELRSFIPREYLREDLRDPDEFLAALGETNIDDVMAERLDRAAGEGNVCRYVAKMESGPSGEKPKMIVRLVEVPKGEPLAQLQGVGNKVVIATASRNEKVSSPIIISAPGAGLDVTARNLRREIWRILPAL